MTKKFIRMILIAIVIALVFVSTIDATEPNNNTNNEVVQNNTTVNQGTVYTVAWSYKTTIKNGKITIKEEPGVKKIVDNEVGGRYEIVEGTTVTIYFIPDYGYHFVGNYLTDDNHSDQYVAATEENAYTFKMPNQNLVLSNYFEKLEKSDVLNGKVANVNSVAFTEFGSDNIKSGQVIVNYTEKEPIADVKTKLDNLASEKNLMIIDYLEIDVENRITKGYAGEQNNTYWSNEITELTNPVTVVVELPEMYRGRAEYKAIRYHGSSTEVLDAQYNAQSGKMSFKTDKFSYYALAINKPTAVAATNPTTNTVANTVANKTTNTAATNKVTNTATTTTSAVTTGNNNPATGDEIDGYITAFIISTFIMVSIALSYKMDKYGISK